MKDWIPLLQALVWPVLIAGVLIWLRSAVSRVVQEIANRIERGDSFEAGPSGVKLGPSQGEKTGRVDLVKEKSLPSDIYLVHRARRDRSLDKNGNEYYRLRLWMDADETEILDQVASVTYHLHPTFREPIRTVSDRESNFMLLTAAWGQFNMYAEVKFKSGREPVVVERYINF